MIDLLQKYLKKLGVEEFSRLSEEEKETYRKWEETLQGRKITDEEVEAFFDTEIEETTKKLINEQYSSREDIFMKMKLEFLGKMKSFLNGPRVEKKMLEQNISRNLNNI
jgi:hypothetical protein